MILPGAGAALEAAELIPLRADEHLDTARLEPFLRAHLERIDGAMSVGQFGGGKANLTYLVRFGETDFVLRRPPLGPVPPGAHDMAREHRVLSRLYRSYRLAPRSFVLCEDAGIIGAPFHMMERRRGFAIRDSLPARFAGQPALNHRIGLALIDALAELHLVAPASVGLESLGRAEGYLGRQLSGWARRWEAALDSPVATMEPVLRWLADTLPASRQGTLLHNDYRLDNLLVDADDPARVSAVLDWDMCTIGDPLADLGYVLNYWAEPQDDPAWIAVAAMPTWQPGFPRRAEAIAHYAARTGFDLGPILWYQVFAAFKLAAIIQQIYTRWRRGQTRDARFAGYGERVAGLAAKAARLAAGA